VYWCTLRADEVFEKFSERWSRRGSIVGMPGSMLVWC